jgi:hypothetical protein
MMQTFRFVGTEAHIGTLKLDRFGKRYSIDSDLATIAQRGGAVLISEEEFRKIGFTDQQLRIWADPFMPLFEIPTDPNEAQDKEDFMRKREAAQQAYRDIRQGLLDQPRVTVMPGDIDVLPGTSQPEDEE